MSYVGRERLQKGEYGAFLGHLDNLLSGAYEVETYVCDDCRKMEFYAARHLEPVEEPEEGTMAQAACPCCGTMHDMDDAVCPYCGKRLMELDPFDNIG